MSGSGLQRKRLKLALRALAALTLVAVALTLAACGSDDDKASLGSGGEGESAAAGSAPSVSPSPLQFPPTEDGTESAIQTVTVSAGTCAEQDCTRTLDTGTTMTPPTDFVVMKGGTAGECRPDQGPARVLKNGESCTMKIKFGPITPGAKDAALKFGSVNTTGARTTGPVLHLLGEATPATFPEDSKEGGKGGESSSAAAAKACKGKKGKAKKKCMKKALAQP